MKKSAIIVMITSLVIGLLVIIILLSKGYFGQKTPIEISDNLIVDENNIEVVNSEITLTSKTWNWLKAETSDGVIEPISQADFSLVFDNEGSFNFTTDCNGGFGTYSVTGSTIELSNMGSTKMYCQDAQEDDFVQMLSEVNAYELTDEGKLVLNTNLGFMIFE